MYQPPEVEKERLSWARCLADAHSNFKALLTKYGASDIFTFQDTSPEFKDIAARELSVALDVVRCVAAETTSETDEFRLWANQLLTIVRPAHLGFSLTPKGSEAPRLRRVTALDDSLDTSCHPASFDFDTASFALVVHDIVCQSDRCSDPELKISQEPEGPGSKAYSA